MRRLLARPPAGWFAYFLLLTHCGGAPSAPGTPHADQTSPNARGGTDITADADASPHAEGAPPGGLGVSSETIGDGPLMTLTGGEIIVGKVRATLPHEAKERSLPLVRTHLPILAGLPPREGDKIRFAQDDVLPFEFRLERTVRGSEFMSALLSAGLEGMPLSRVDGNSVYLYVISPSRPDEAPLHARRMQWPERALLVKVREGGLEFLRVPASSEGAAPASEQVAHLGAGASPQDISATLDRICSASAPCSPFGINPGPESSGALFLDLLSAMQRRKEFQLPASPPPSALLLVGEPERIPLISARQRVGDTKVNGRLPVETIRKVVRASFGEYRKCYETGLARDARLEGEVRLRFVIARDGKVSATSVAPESTMPDQTVSACINDAFSKLVFPEPEGGIVTVTYPLRFSPH